MKSTTIVTKDSIKKLLEERDPAHVVGRALVVIFQRQTKNEQADNQTSERNDVGFTGFDGKGGSLTAKSYLKRGTLQDWQIKKWTKIGKDGYPRICRYHKQLNEAAIEKQNARG
jgi:hypothetical protein